MSDIISFKADLNRFAESIDAKVQDAIRRIVIELFNRFTFENPVDTGYSQSNWRISINEPDTTVSNPPTSQERDANKGKKGWINNALGADLSEIVGLTTIGIGRVESGDSVYVTNSVDYVRYLNEGTSKQAPSGWIQIAIAQVVAQVNESVQMAAKA
jgi:hypothetical protein